jgi:hypothetical protein
MVDQGGYSNGGAGAGLQSPRSGAGRDGGVAVLS